MKQNTPAKRELSCNIALILVLLATVAHLIILTLALFSVLNTEYFEDFNFIFAYALSIISLILFVVSIFSHKFSRLEIPSWFRILFYIAFFLFTNTYYICGWYQTVVGLVFCFAYFAFLVSIISLSIYFNTQKDDKNKLKVVPKSILSSIFFYSVASCSIFQFVVNFVKALAFAKSKLSTLSVYIVEFGTMLAVIIIVTIVFAISLAKSKKLINGCLIKHID